MCQTCDVDVFLAEAQEQLDRLRALHPDEVLVDAIQTIEGLVDLVSRAHHVRPRTWQVVRDLYTALEDRVTLTAGPAPALE